MFAFKLRFYLLILVSVFSSGCLPAIFTGAGRTAVEFAKDVPPGETLTDVKIASSIRTKLARQNFRQLFTKIKVEVTQGRVFYSGVIDKEEDALKAVEIAWAQEGVLEVVNELKVDKNSGHFDLVQYTRDTMITSQIKTKMFIDRNIKFVNYTVITINDIVYLWGIARSEEELEKVAGIAANIHGAKQVVSHVKVQRLANRVKNKDKGDTESNDGSDLIIEEDSSASLQDDAGKDW